MKTKFALMFGVLPLLLGGCYFLIPNKTTSSSGDKSESNSSSGESNSSDSSSNYSSSEAEKGVIPIEIYATNDIHGAIEEESSRAGVPKLMTYLNEKGKNPNTLLIDQGDTWQGSIYSNYNHGELITDLMNYVQFDARSVGNHDFDWGVDYIKTNTAKSYDGYSTPVLAGNVYDYDFDTKTEGTIQQSDIGIKSVTYRLENGLKVGILGGIGNSQITSITSSYTRDICFKNHIEFIKDEATHLKNDEHCNIIIASIHEGQEGLIGNGLEDYVDLVLCGHTHRQENYHEGNLYYSQSRAYTQSLAHITLLYDYNTEDVTKTTIENITGYTVRNETSTVDPTIQAITEQYMSDCQEAADEHVATNVYGTFESDDQYPNLMCKAIFDECVEEGFDDVLVTYVNKARVTNYSSAWKYSHLYEGFPFDNQVFIAEITGSEFLREIGWYNHIYRNPNFTSNDINPNGKYKIAVLDYLYFHTNELRYYDYFPTTGGTSYVTLDKNYREILRDWLKDNGYANGKELLAADYSSSLWNHDRTLFTSI